MVAQVEAFKRRMEAVADEGSHWSAARVQNERKPCGAASAAASPVGMNSAGAGKATSGTKDRAIINAVSWEGAVVHPAVIAKTSVSAAKRLTTNQPQRIGRKDRCAAFAIR
jgi:hypothetical protein